MCSKTIGIVTAMALMIIFFYTYTGILGKNISVVDIASFFVEAIIGEWVAYIFTDNKIKCNRVIAIAVLIIIFICFITFTFFTPNIGIFKDPITGKYGIT